MPHILRDHFPGAFIVRLKVHSLWKKGMNKNLIVHKFYSCNTEASWLTVIWMLLLHKSFYFNHLQGGFTLWTSIPEAVVEVIKVKILLFRWGFFYSDFHNIISIHHHLSTSLHISLHGHMPGLGKRGLQHIRWNESKIGWVHVRHRIEKACNITTVSWFPFSTGTTTSV